MMGKEWAWLLAPEPSCSPRTRGSRGDALSSPWSHTGLPRFCNYLRAGRAQGTNARPVGWCERKLRLSRDQ